MHSRDALLAIARYAKGQWGMVTSAQATAVGVNYMQLKRMTEAGLLERIGPGVYLMIGGQASASRNHAHKVAWLRLDPEVPGWERPLLGRNSAVVSHGSAALLLQLGDLVVRDVEFTVTRRRTSRDPAVKLYNRPLAAYEVTWADGLPVTTATRTLTDLLAAGIPAANAGSFLAEALDRRMLNVGNVIDSLTPFAASYGCKPGDGEGLVEFLLTQAPAASGIWDRERTVADLARELLKLSDAQLRSLRSLASAAKEPAIAALLSRIAQDLPGLTAEPPHTGRAAEILHPAGAPSRRIPAAPPSRRIPAAPPRSCIRPVCPAAAYRPRRRDPASGLAAEPRIRPGRPGRRIPAEPPHTAVPSRSARPPRWDAHPTPLRCGAVDRVTGQNHHVAARRARRRGLAEPGGTTTSQHAQPRAPRPTAHHVPCARHSGFVLFAVGLLWARGSGGASHG